MTHTLTHEWKSNSFDLSTVLSHLLFFFSIAHFFSLWIFMSWIIYHVMTTNLFDSKMIRNKLIWFVRPSLSLHLSPVFFFSLFIFLYISSLCISTLRTAHSTASFDRLWLREYYVSEIAWVFYLFLLRRPIWYINSESLLNAHNFYTYIFISYTHIACVCVCVRVFSAQHWMRAREYICPLSMTSEIVIIICCVFIENKTKEEEEEKKTKSLSMQ